MQVIRNLLHITALDWIPIMLNDGKLEGPSLPSTARINDLKEQLTNADSESLKEISSFSNDLVNKEDQRRLQIESKANSLIGITGLAAGFITGFAQFSLNSDHYLGGYRISLSILYVLIGFALLSTIIIARRATIVDKYAYIEPLPQDMLAIRKWSRDILIRNHTAKMMYSSEYNAALNNRKATYVIGAQDWFRNSIVLLLILLLFLAFGPLAKGAEPDTQPLPIIIVTSQPAPSATPFPTKTSSPAPSVTALTPSRQPHMTSTPAIITTESTATIPAKVATSSHTPTEVLDEPNENP